MLSRALASLEDPAHLVGGVAFEDGRAGDEDLRARFDHERSGLGRDTPVYFDGNTRHQLQSPDLLDHLGDEILASETRVDAHNVYVIHVRKSPLDRFGRGSRIEGHPGLAAPGPDQLQGTVQVNDDLGLDRDAFDTGFYEGWDQ